MSKKFFVPMCAIGLLFSANAVGETCVEIDSTYSAVTFPLNNLRNARVHAQAVTQKDPFALKNDPNTTVLEVWDEDHCSDGKLFKVGDSAKPEIDPRRQVGTWGNDNDTLRGTGPKIYYAYTGDQTYTWKLYKIGASGLRDYPQVGDKFCWESIAAVPEAIATGTVEQIVNCGALAGNP